MIEHSTNISWDEKLFLILRKKKETIKSKLFF